MVWGELVFSGEMDAFAFGRVKRYFPFFTPFPYNGNVILNFIPRGYLAAFVYENQRVVREECQFSVGRLESQRCIFNLTLRNLTNLEHT